METVKTYGNLYRVHKRISHERPNYDLLDSVIVLSIDPGLKDLGIYVEERHKCGLIKMLGCYKFNIGHGRGSNDSMLYTNLQEVFNTGDLGYYSRICHYVIIEEQFYKNRIIIHRTAQSFITFFLMVENPNYPYIIELNSKMKNSIFRKLGDDVPKKKEGPEGYKIWFVGKAIQLLKDRQDYDGLEMLYSLDTKLSDVADCIAQAEAFFIHLTFQDKRRDGGRESTLIYRQILSRVLSEDDLLEISEILDIPLEYRTHERSYLPQFDIDTRLISELSGRQYYKKDDLIKYCRNLRLSIKSSMRKGILAGILLEFLTPYLEDN